jgi:hypothetical protein
MTERAVNDRRAWKAQTYDFDYFTGEPGRSCTVCLTDKQRELLLGLTEPVSWSTRWWSNIGTTINQDTIDEFRDDIRRRIIMACCGDEEPIQFRYDTDGNLERSSDGGVTFYPAPTYDPRNTSVQFPEPAAVDNGKCIAADGAVKLLKEQVGDQLTDDMTRYTLAQLIHDWITIYLQSSSWFDALIQILTNQIFALVIAVLRPALTDEVYATLKCLIYENMSTDYDFTDSTWSTLRSQILSSITGIAGVFFEHLFFLLGVVGTNNLVRSGAGDPDADCSTCECASPCVDMWTVYFGTMLSNSGCNIQAEYALDAGKATVSLTWDGVHACKFTAWGVLTGSITDTHWQWYLADGSGPFTSIVAPVNQNLQTLVVYGTDSTPFTISLDFTPM